MTKELSLKVRRILFLKLFKRAQKKYGRSKKRLAGEGWDTSWKLLVATILSAQSRDEMTILIAKRLFVNYPNLKKLACASVSGIEQSLKGMNYYKTKARNVKGTAQGLLKDFCGRVPDEIDELVKLPGVGRKTANLIITELYDKDGICVDTHVHRIANVLGLVHTKTRDKTEEALKEVAPRSYWKKINRIFVLWGKEVPGRDADRLLRKLER